MDETLEAMEAAAVVPAGEYMRDPTAARMEHIALCHLEALMQRGMTAREALAAARSATAAALDSAYLEIGGDDGRKRA